MRLQIDTPKQNVVKTKLDSKYDNHFECNSQPNQGDLYDHLMSTSILTLVMKKDVHATSKEYDESGYGHDLDLLIILYK